MISAPRQGWPLAVSVVAVFALGTAAGAYGWSVYDRAGESSEAVLLAGPVTTQDGRALGVDTVGVGAEDFGADSFDVSANVFNGGDSDVTVVDVRPHGWIVDSSPPATRVPAGEWASIPVTVTPDCAGPWPDSGVDVRLDSERGVVTAQAATRNGEGFRVFWVVLCTGPGIRPLLDDIEITADGDVLDMRVPVHVAAWRSDAVTLLGMDSAAPAFQATAPGLPLQLAPGDTETVTLHWTVENCRTVSQLSDVQLGTRTDAQGNLFALPGHAVAALARLGVAACTE
ncbi:MAG: hypothetical protein ACODAF_04505 [Actinomycetota bacterium]